MIAINGHRMAAREDGRVYHSMHCACGRITVDRETWVAMVEFEMLYKSNPCGLDLEEFAVKLGFTAAAYTETIDDNL